MGLVDPHLPQRGRQAQTAEEVSGGGDGLPAHGQIVLARQAEDGPAVLAEFPGGVRPQNEVHPGRRQNSQTHAVGDVIES